MGGGGGGGGGGDGVLDGKGVLGGKAGVVGFGVLSVDKMGVLLVAEVDV